MLRITQKLSQKSLNLPLRNVPLAIGFISGIHSYFLRKGGCWTFSGFVTVLWFLMLRSEEGGKEMRRAAFLLAVVMCFGMVLPLLAVQVSEDDNYVIIETDGYKVCWKKGAQMGYMQAFVAGSPNSIIGTNGRAFYHSSSYAGGWKDWGALLTWEIVEEVAGKAVIKYESNDGGTKEYTCVATYYDGVPYIKHELTITNTGDPTTSFVSGHEPQFEVNVDMAGMETFTDPFPHGVYWTADGYFGAIYGPDAGSASAAAWGDRDPGRVQLSHDNLGVEIASGESASVTYYVAFGEGGRDEGTALAAHVQEEPSSVSPVGSLTTTWGQIRAGR
jgi:hypothetical protein